MSLLTQQLRFWELLYHLVNKEGMRVVHLSKSDREAWLEDDRKEPYQIIRICRKDLDWSRELRSDIKETEQKAKQVRKKLGLRQANVISLIVSTYPPVDSWEELTDRPLPLTAGGKQQMRTILLTEDTLQTVMFPLATEWKLKEMPDFLPPGMIEEEDEMVRMLRRQVKKAEDKRIEDERSLFLYGKPVFTFLLLAAILGMFALVEREGSSTDIRTLIKFGAKFNPLIHDGEWWRFFSAMFLHIGFLHLFMNSLALFYLGGAVERIFGTGRFIIIYAVAGLSGSVASFAFNEQVSAGASGAIFGCFGALLYFGLKHKRLFFRTMGMNVIVILIINLSLGFLVPMIDNGAHIGGLVGGFFASAIVNLPRSSFNTGRRLAALGITVIGIFALMVYGYTKPSDGSGSLAYAQIGQEYFQEEEYDEARRYLTLAVEGGVQMKEVYFLLGNTYAMEDQLDEAEPYFKKAIELDQDFAPAHYNLALVYYQTGKIEVAKDSVERAVSLDPDNSQFRELQEEIERRNPS
ncbi:rhomboid family intramembrane serine protease [Bacillus sp. H-16]|uniref:rhomboid family intramembrane serine protease n=1 Tax=Alteribacter salitolerans TaxID=2912333 RepID=UPI001962A987|nr:rhomboid family intramembrane serine protease [Alteribacter salitolerans]MBM7097339.1 rhomboid family intramembrane serine protease [Alteribacter salitolerans]